MSSSLAVSHVGGVPAAAAVPVAPVPTIDSIYSLRRVILEASQTSPAGIKQKVVWLQNLNSRITELKTQCAALTADTDATVQGLSKFRFFAKLCDRIGLNFLNGKIGKARICVNRSLRDVEVAIQTITNRELTCGFKPEEQSQPSFHIDLIHFYDLINRLNPNNWLYLRSHAGLSLSEGAFKTAYTSYTTLCERNPELIRGVKVDMIRALMGSKNYEKALQEILDAKNELFPPNSPYENQRGTLDLLKATCLMELKRHDEAREVLVGMFGVQGAPYEVLQNLVLITIGEAAGAVPYDPSLFERAKKMYGSLPMFTHRSVAWTKDCLVSDFAFWLHNAMSKVITSNDTLFARTLERISEFLKSKTVSSKALLETFLFEVMKQEQNAQSFLKRYHEFAAVTQNPIPDAANPIIEARREALKIQLFGVDKLYGSSGMIKNLATFTEVLRLFRESKEFEDGESKQTLQQIEDLLKQTANALNTGKESMVKTIENGTHPYINAASFQQLMLEGK